MIYFFFGKVPKLGIFTFNYLRRKTNLYVSALAVHCEGRRQVVEGDEKVQVLLSLQEV